MPNREFILDKRLDDNNLQFVKNMLQIWNLLNFLSIIIKELYLKTQRILS